MKRFSPRLSPLRCRCRRHLPPRRLSVPARHHHRAVCSGRPTDIIARIVGEIFLEVARSAVRRRERRGRRRNHRHHARRAIEADGYTIMMGHMGTHGAAPALYPNLKYDPVKDFEPIGLAAGTPILIVARKDFPAANLKSSSRA
jgi:tripartite-type tricarboxylate transporter receptor subunit TctC